MVTPKINENNYRQFVEQISESRKAWAKNVSDSAIIIMERQRHLMGLSLLKFYGEFLGCPMNIRTYRKLVNREIPVPQELLLSFCFTFGYDIGKFDNVSKLIDSQDSFGDYQQIGAAIESLGKAGVYQLSEAIQKFCTDATLYNRRRCAEILTKFAENLEYRDNASVNPKEISDMADSVNKAADEALAEFARKNEKEASSDDVVLDFLMKDKDKKEER